MTAINNAFIQTGSGKRDFLEAGESVNHSIVFVFFVNKGTAAYQAPVHGILQARILEWVAIPFSQGSLTQESILPTWQADAVPFGSPGSPLRRRYTGKSLKTLQIPTSSSES